MKVLAACFKPKDESENLFVPELISALEKCGIDVTWSSEEFWCPTQKYDIIHLQWPEALFDWCVGGAYAISALKWRLQCWKATGAKIVLTRHNENKHYAAASYYRDLYRVAENACDAIIHMAEYSRCQMIKAGCDTSIRHYVIPHHVYESVNRNITQSEAREQLGLSRARRLVLAFGAFRDDEERILVLSAAKCLKRDSVRIYAPRLFNGNATIRYFLRSPCELRRRLRMIKYGLNLQSCGPVDKRRMELLFAACDVVLVPRKRVLNSGNLPMGFYFGKVVVGPDRGNVGELLRASGNPVFDPDDVTSVVAAVKKGLELSDNGKGLENQALADRLWDSNIVGRSLFDAYTDLLK